jgi:methanogenic corrinoid protein MtbC1
MPAKNNVKVLRVNNLLTHAMVKLDEDSVRDLFQQGLEKGIDLVILLEEARAGVQKVCDLYEHGKYFLGDLIVAAEIFQEIAVTAQGTKIAQTTSPLPPIIFGTVEDDIHDIGKNITIGILRSKGFEVADLGVDVPAPAFVEAVRKTGSSVVCLSGLITAAYDSMKKTVGLLDREGLRPGAAVVIGGLVGEEVRQYTGADYWVRDCTTGCQVCDAILHSSPGELPPLLRSGSEGFQAGHHLEWLPASLTTA